MNKPLKAEQLSARHFTTVFTSGNSQAVRLPKAFRFSDKTIEILRRGDEVILRAHRPTLAEVLAALPPLSAPEAAEWDDVMANVRADQDEPRERDWSWMADDETTARKPTRRGDKALKKPTSARQTAKRRS